MRYISDDGKVFNTEKECCEHEQRLNKIREEEIVQKQKLESGRKNLMNQISQKRKELREVTKTYYDKFGVSIGEYLPFGEFLKILYEN